MSITDLVRSSLQGACDRLIGEPISYRGDTGAGMSVDAEFPIDVTEPTVGGLDPDENTVEVQIDEEYEGGTLACNVTANAVLSIEALMSKASAYASAENGLVRIFDAEFNDHYASVIFDINVELTFLGILNPEYESVEDLTYDGAVMA